MRLTRRVLLGSAAGLIPFAALAGKTPAPPDAHVYIIWPNQGEKVSKNGFWCRFGLRNMGVTRAGDNFANSGHHHLLIDVEAPLNLDEPIPSDRNHIHYGAGQTEARLELPPGPHTLQLVLGDAEHIPFNPPVMSAKVKITVV